MAIALSAAEILGIIFEGILYGAYAVLFILYMILRRHDNRAVHAPLALAQMLLFGLCTISLCLDIPTAYFFVVPDVKNTDTAFKFDIGSFVIFALADYLAQMILLYRCWIVWGRRWAVVALPGFLALVTLGGGFTQVGLFLNSSSRLARLYGIATYSTSLVVNALTTSLIVTKILLASREARSALGSNLHRSLHVVTAMLIESGILIFASQVAFVVLLSLRHPATDLISYSMTQIYGITPTLLNIRVLMGSTYDETTERTRSLRFARSGGAATQTTGPSTSVAEAQFRGIITELDNASNYKRAADDVV
ncbi:hypothetical protein BD779DRAFT_1558871 [Infundibulicybe gibba]|nr:hypothetical protein BD779DRAFT_1558871 [Infundibulicybe gibba]